MDESAYFYKKRSSVKKIVVGSLLILAGFLALGFNLGWLPVEYKAAVFSWPMLLIAIGLINLADKCSWITGAIITIVGIVFLLPRIPGSGIISMEIVFWPMILIALGIFVLTKRFRKRRQYRMHWKHHIDLEKKTEDGFVFEQNIFGGNKRVLSGEFKGGKIINIFGGSEIDLTRCTLPDGKHVLDIECVFGGVEMRVPPDWKIQVEMSPVMGGFVDRRKVFSTANSNAELLIKGTVVFGGGEIKS